MCEKVSTNQNQATSVSLKNLAIKTQPRYIDFSDAKVVVFSGLAVSINPHPCFAMSLKRNRIKKMLFYVCGMFNGMFNDDLSFNLIRIDKKCLNTSITKI